LNTIISSLQNEIKGFGTKCQETVTWADDMKYTSLNATVDEGNTTQIEIDSLPPMVQGKDGRGKDGNQMIKPLKDDMGRVTDESGRTQQKLTQNNKGVAGSLGEYQGEIQETLINKPTEVHKVEKLNDKESFREHGIPENEIAHKKREIECTRRKMANESKNMCMAKIAYKTMLL
jgi:hypothetical protein